MRSVSRWDPMAVARGMHPMFRASDTLQPTQWVPALDLNETAEAYEVTLEVAGMDPADIEVNYERGTLVIRGERKDERDEKEAGWRRIERSYGAFSRAVRIASPVDGEAIEAGYTDGVLTVKLPKAAEAKRHQIEVKS